ncbi:presenilin family intramembrane aspartyl protease PSH [Haloferacaceae archaeon DSL9]
MFPREYRGVALAVLLFVLVQLGALALVPTFSQEGYQAVDNPDDPTNSVLYLGAILVATAFMLAAFKYDFQWVIRGVIIGTSGLLGWYVFSALFSPVVALAPAAAIALALYVYPEWYVIDAAGVVMGAGAAGLFGISFGLLPAVVLLVALAIYDAIAVYRTKHMLRLADGVMDLNLPVVLVLPLSPSFSLLDDAPAGSLGTDGGHAGAQTGADAAVDDADAAADGADVAAEAAVDPDATADDTPDREAFFIGLGDAVIPTVLVASAAVFSPAPPLSTSVIAINLPALAAMGGMLAGLLVLMRMVMKGRPHAGLPLLNGGTIGGYLLGSVLAGVSLADAFGLGVLF